MGTVSVWGDEKVLEMDDRGGCATLSMSLMSLNYILKMVKMERLVLRILYYKIVF